MQYVKNIQKDFLSLRSRVRMSPPSKNRCQYFSFIFPRSLVNYTYQILLPWKWEKYHQSYIFCSVSTQSHKLGNKILTCGQLALSPNSGFLKIIFAQEDNKVRTALLLKGCDPMNQITWHLTAVHHGE